MAPAMFPVRLAGPHFHIVDANARQTAVSPLPRIVTLTSKFESRADYGCTAFDAFDDALDADNGCTKPDSNGVLMSVRLRIGIRHCCDECSPDDSELSRGGSCQLSVEHPSTPQRSNPKHEGTYFGGGCARGRHRIGARRKRHCIALFDAGTGHKNCQRSLTSRWCIDRRA